MWVQSNSFQMQMAHLESTPELLPSDVEIAKE